MNKSASGFIIKVHGIPFHGFIIKVHGREQGGHILLIIRHDQLVEVGLIDVFEDVEAEVRDLTEDLMVVYGAAAGVSLSVNDLACM